MTKHFFVFLGKFSISLLVISHFDVTFLVFWFSYSNSIHICFLNGSNFYCPVTCIFTYQYSEYQYICVYFSHIGPISVSFFNCCFPFRFFCCLSNAAVIMLAEYVCAHLWQECCFYFPKCVFQGELLNKKVCTF